MILSTSLTAVVLTGAVAAATSGQSAWQTDYATALARAAESNKPIAVFIAQGGTGYARVVADGGLSTDDARRLKEGYVCLSVDTNTAKGKKLAAAFEMTEGLVISDRTGAKQALRHDGKVTPSDLALYVTRYADPDRVIVTTETPATLFQASQVVTPTAAVQPVYAPPAPAYYPAVRPVAAGCST